MYMCGSDYVKEEIDVRDEIFCGKEVFEIGKCLVIVKRRKGKIIALRPVINWLHLQNIANKLQQDKNYRNEFLQKYKWSGMKYDGK